MLDTVAQRGGAHARADDAAAGEALDRSAARGGPRPLLRTVCESKRGQLPVVELALERSRPVEVSAHPQRLERIIGHVVQNALDATNRMVR
jgi:C4-dicarboxylate-specific signal transduction histidine kinase